MNELMDELFEYYQETQPMEEEEKKVMKFKAKYVHACSSVCEMVEAKIWYYFCDDCQIKSHHYLWLK